MAAVQSEASYPTWGAAADKARMAHNFTSTEDQDDECSICFDRKVTINFQPCKHGACSDCVDSLRRRVIFKVMCFQASLTAKFILQPCV